MALAITVNAVLNLHKDFLVRGTIVASGTYPTGGDTLNFATATFNLGVDGIKSSSGPKFLTISSQVAGAGTPNTVLFQYSGRPGALLTNSFMQVFTGSAAQSAGAELSAGAYPAGVTGDTIAFQAYFAKL